MDTIISTIEPSYIRVCLCPCEHSHCYTNSIPLRNLYKTLVGYLGDHGGTGNLRIEMYYRDDDGTIKPLLQEQLTSK